MSNSSDTSVKQRGCSGVIGVVVGVNEIGNLVADAVSDRNLIHGPLDVVSQSCGSVKQDDSIISGHKCTLVVRIRNPVEVPHDPPDVVALLTHRRSEPRPADPRTTSEWNTGRRARV